MFLNENVGNSAEMSSNGGQGGGAVGGFVAEIKNSLSSTGSHTGGFKSEESVSPR